MTYKEFKLRMEVMHDVQGKIKDRSRTGDLTSKKGPGLDIAISIVQNQKESLCSRVPREFVSAYAKERVKS